MKTQKRIENDFGPEVKSLFKALLKVGFQIDDIDNGRDYEEESVESFKWDGNIDNAVKEAVACDEAQVLVSINCKSYWMLLVLGNSPGELVNDFTCNQELEAVVDAHSNKWFGRRQPTKEYNA